MNIPFQITMVMTYGWFQRSFNPEKQYNPTIHACAGAFAGLFKDIFGQMLLDMFSFWHSKSKNFWKSLPKKNSWNQMYQLWNWFTFILRIFWPGIFSIFWYLGTYAAASLLSMFILLSFLINKSNIMSFTFYHIFFY